MSFHIVLLEPEIPQNTGNIGRTCVATGTKLHLIEPMGFRLDEKRIRRAGLDYWAQLELTVHPYYREFIERYEEDCEAFSAIMQAGCGSENVSPAAGCRNESESSTADYRNESESSAAGCGSEKKSSLVDSGSIRKPKIWMATTKAHQTYSEVSYQPGDYIMFGKESAGIPEEILVEHEEDCIRIPMIGDIRSLNLGNSVAIVLYEALRQNQFSDMNKNGQLHRLQWR